MKERFLVDLNNESVNQKLNPAEAKSHSIIEESINYGELNIHREYINHYFPSLKSTEALMHLDVRERKILEYIAKKIKNKNLQEIEKI